MLGAAMPAKCVVKMFGEIDFKFEISDGKNLVKFDG